MPEIKKFSKEFLLSEKGSLYVFVILRQRAMIILNGVLMMFTDSPKIWIYVQYSTVGLSDEYGSDGTVQYTVHIHLNFVKMLLR